MSLPREVVPGHSYMMTRRCTQRQFLLRPDAETSNAFFYCLAVAAARAGVGITFALAMSNHIHVGVYDPEGRYPEFLEHFHKLLAKCRNAQLGRWENFWSSEQTSVVRLVEPTDALDKMVYALLNPVAASLVTRAAHWPGASSLAAMLTNKPVAAIRPRPFFREDGIMPEVVSLRFVRPQGFEDVSHEDFSRILKTRIREGELAAAKRRAETGRSVLGLARVLAQRWTDTPFTPEPRRELSPRVAARSKWARIEALLRNKRFVEAYRAARDAFVAGVREVIFPPGTYWLRRFAQVDAAPA